jgi:hypothetical protein
VQPLKRRRQTDTGGGIKSADGGAIDVPCVLWQFKDEAGRRTCPGGGNIVDDGGEDATETSAGRPIEGGDWSLDEAGGDGGAGGIVRAAQQHQRQGGTIVVCHQQGRCPPCELDGSSDGSGLNRAAFRGAVWGASGRTRQSMPAGAGAVADGKGAGLVDATDESQGAGAQTGGGFGRERRQGAGAITGVEGGPGVGVG